MKLGNTLRTLGTLRRIAVALESLAESQKRLADLQLAEWESTHAPRSQKNPVVISHFDPDAASERYLEDLQTKGY